MKKPLVAIWTMTYNHCNYIKNVWMELYTKNKF